ncbi:MAG: alanine racemase [Lautropia sp.]|nr:alanine racemase [Lautropia sp.]
MPRKLTATISLDAMAHNLAQARRQAPSAFQWAVVKADAYGHGLLNAMRGFSAADGLALIEFDGAARLRAAGWQKPVLMLEGAFDSDDVAQSGQQQLTLVVHRAEHLQWLAAHRGPAIDVLMKINTGLNRLGFGPDEALQVVRELAGIPGVRLRGVMTHFANADVEGGAQAPMAVFDGLMAAMQPWLPADGQQCLANSAALFSLPVSHRQAVRPGIALYGASPYTDGRTAQVLGLHAAMRLQGSLLAVQILQAGEATGYGGRFVADRPMRVGIVDCGYADGYPRVAATGTPVAVDGVRTRILGRVSMDMLAIDLEPVPGALVGAPVELWGDRVSIDEVAAGAGTLGYELMCALAPRVARSVA